MSTNFVKIVTATAAAAALGGFSFPHAHTCDEAQAVSVTAARKHLAGHRDNVTIEEAREAFLDSRAFVRHVEEVTKLDLLWTHTGSWGGRRIELDPGTEPIEVVDDGDFGDWLGYDPSRVIVAEYTSATSGSGLLYVRTRKGRVPGGTLEFVRSPKDFGYRGQYFAAWEAAKGRILKEAGSRLVYTTG